MMEKINFSYIYERTRRMVLNPEAEWKIIGEEYNTPKEIFTHYLFPVSVVSSLSIFLFGFFHYSAWQTVGFGLINLVASMVGIWVAYLLIREFLSNKLRDADNIALNLSVYSGAVFILFHGLGIAFGKYFMGQLFTLVSFIFIRTLYLGIRGMGKLQGGQQTNLLIIGALAIACLPVIITQLLMIIFRISAFNI